jgi:hypothetical protein
MRKLVLLGGQDGKQRITCIHAYLMLGSLRITPWRITYGASSRSFAVEDFWERETSRQTETFGRVAHVLSTYESLRDPRVPPFERGANSMQLFRRRLALVDRQRHVEHVTQLLA